jgi:hypothetical protein
VRVPGVQRAEGFLGLDRCFGYVFDH